MISASKEFKEKLKNGANLVNYADITLSDGEVLHLTYKDFMIGGCQIEDKTTDGKFGVGFCIGKTLSIRLENNDERFSKYDFYQSIINLYVAMQLDDGTVEKIRKGVFYTVVPETPGDIIEISAVDGMYLLDRDYSASTTAYPATLQTIISDACLDCGIPIGFRQFDNMNFTVQEKPEKSTYRQIVSYACQIAGYNAHIDNNGYMQLIWYNSALLERYNYDGGNFKIYPHDTVIDGGNFTDYSTDTIISGGNFTDEIPEHIFRIKSLTVSTDNVQITGIRVLGEDKKEALFGEEGYLIELNGNPFVNGREQEIANYLGNRIVGMAFRPFTAQVLNNPLYEPFEIVRVSDRKGNVYNSILNSVSYKIGGYTQVVCEAEAPVRNGSRYVSAAAQAVVEARRNAKKQLTTYDKAVQNMNQLAANAMGFHTTYEDQPDGSRITYLHDKPTLKESKTIYKQTIDGFFISTDGGKTYTAGFDKNGNAVVNILYAIGIVCDWIRGGTLTLGGADNVNGIFQVLGANGDVVCKITKDGLISNQGNLNQDIDAAQSSIRQNAEGITAEVNRAKESETELSSKIQLNTNSITAEVKRAHDQEIELAAAISMQADQIKLKVSKGSVSSEISQEAGKVSIKSNRFSLESDNLIISEDGTINAKNGNFSGTIISSNAYITGGQIKMVTASQTYDTIDLMYGNSRTRISPDFIRLDQDGSVYSQLSGSQISMSSIRDGKLFARAGLITLENSSGVTTTLGANSNFGGIINVLGTGESIFSGDLRVSGNLSTVGGFDLPVKFKGDVELTTSSSGLHLASNVKFECGGNAEFFGTIKRGTDFTVGVGGTITCNGAIKSTGAYTSSFYSLESKNALSVGGAFSVSGGTSLNGSVKVGGSTSNPVGFFGSNGSGKKSVNTITLTSSATASSNATKINEIINALKAYNLL